MICFEKENRLLEIERELLAAQQERLSGVAGYSIDDLDDALTNTIQEVTCLIAGRIQTRG